MKEFLIVAEGLGFIALLLSVIVLGVYSVGWLALAATSFFPMIGKRHRHDDWEEMNRHP